MLAEIFERSDSDSDACLNFNRYVQETTSAPSVDETRLVKLKSLSLCLTALVYDLMAMFSRTLVPAKKEVLNEKVSSFLRVQERERERERESKLTMTSLLLLSPHDYAHFGRSSFSACVRWACFE